MIYHRNTNTWFVCLNVTCYFKGKSGYLGLATIMIHAVIWYISLANLFLIVYVMQDIEMK